MRQFLYFEEEMLAPNPDDYFAEWNLTKGGGSRKSSTSLWIYERETKSKRFSVTTEAGAKIQPYFDVPPISDPNLYLFTVLGESIDAGLVRVWVTEATARELKHLLGTLGTSTLSQSILQNAAKIALADEIETAKTEIAQPLLLTMSAYQALQEALPGVSDEHSMQQFTQFLRHPLSDE